MAQVWVRAKTILHIENNGKMRQVHPGDWCQVGRHQAREWLANNQCEILKREVLTTVQDLTNCAIYLKNSNEQERGHISAKFPGVPIVDWRGYPAKHGRFLVWDMTAQLRQDLILVGFNLLLKWQCAIPLVGFDVLAEAVGTPVEQEETKTVVHDLRVPMYNPKVIFARRCHETMGLFDRWDGVGELSFLRALYQSRPIVNALPPTWINS